MTLIVRSSSLASKHWNLRDFHLLVTVFTNLVFILISKTFLVHCCWQGLFNCVKTIKCDGYNSWSLTLSKVFQHPRCTSNVHVSPDPVAVPVSSDTVPVAPVNVPVSSDYSPVSFYSDHVHPRKPVSPTHRDPWTNEAAHVWFSHRSGPTMCIAKLLIIYYKSPVLCIMMLNLTLCQVSYYLLQEPRTLHYVVKSDALLAWISTSCTERDFWRDYLTCGCDDVSVSPDPVLVCLIMLMSLLILFLSLLIMFLSPLVLFVSDCLSSQIISMSILILPNHVHVSTDHVHVFTDHVTVFPYHVHVSTDTVPVFPDHTLFHLIIFVAHLIMSLPAWSCSCLHWSCSCLHWHCPCLPWSCPCLIWSYLCLL